MANLSVPEMLEQVSPGEERIFLPGASDTSHPQRFLEITRNFTRDASRKATSFEWANFSPEVARATTGGLSGKRVSLDETPQMEVTFLGNPANALDYYDLNSDIFFASEKLKSLIELVDPEAVEFRDVLFSNGKAPTSKYYSAMPNRVIWGVDVAATEVKITNTEFFPGMYSPSVYYGDEVFLREDIDQNVHVFKDFGSVYQFWSAELVHSLSEKRVTGISGRDPSRRFSGLGIDL
jgi:hypothetical protein